MRFLILISLMFILPAFAVADDSQLYRIEGKTVRILDISGEEARNCANWTVEDIVTANEEGTFSDIEWAATKVSVLRRIGYIVSERKEQNKPKLDEKVYQDLRTCFRRLNGHD